MNRRIKLAAVAVVLTVGTSAAMRHSAAAQELSGRQAVVCTAIDERAQKISSGFDQRLQKLNEAKDALTAGKNSYRSEVDSKKAELRVEGDDKRREVYDVMYENATTDNTKTSIEEYAQGAEAALAAVRQAHDNTTTEYRQKVDTFIETRHQATDTAVQNFRAAVTSAVTKAQTACRGSSPDLAEIRQEFVDSLQKARLAYADARRNLTPSVSDAIKQFKAERNQARADARSQFERAMQANRPDITSGDRM